MTEAATTPATKRERQFGRVYDHDKGVVTINAAFKPDYTQALEVNKIPTAMLLGFAMQNAADYVVGEGNEVLRDPNAGATVEARREAALAAMQEAIQEIMEGKVDFRSGVGLGGMRSAIGALGAVLFEMGKTFVKNQRGETLAFNDLHTARKAVKDLYLDTVPKGPFKPRVDEKTGEPVMNKAGEQFMDPVAKDSNLTGRMIFNTICDIPAVKEALAAKRVVTNKNPVNEADVLG